MASGGSEPEPTLLIRLRIIEGEDEFTVTKELDFLSIGHQLDLQSFIRHVHEFGIAEVEFRL